jgi:hypothetical protein
MTTLASLAANSIDLENITTLAGILNTTADDVETTNQIMENQLVYNLATDLTGEDISNNTVNDIYVSEQTGLSLFANQLSSQLRSIFDIVTPANSNDGNFALSAQYVESIQVDYDSVNNLIGNDISKNISIVAPTVSIYDSHINISSYNNNGPFSDVSNNFTVYFDGSNNNNNIIRALNSKYATTDNSNPLKVHEHTSFNQTYALGQNINKYFTVDSETGEPVPQDISSTFQPSLNGFTVSNAPTATPSDNTQFGTYKIQQVADSPALVITTDTNSPDQSGSQEEYNDIANMPLFNSTLVLNGEKSLPQSISSFEQYQSAFDSEEEPWSIVAGYNFTITVNQSANSGYHVKDRENHNNPKLLTDQDTTFTLDNSNLTDNYTYMQSYVSGIHDISFSNATLRIVPDGNGSSMNMSSNLISLNNTREVLTESEFQDGQIFLNINSFSTRVTENQNGIMFGLANALATNVIYDGEDGVNGRQGIESDLQINSYVQYVNELVVKNAFNDDNYAYSNGASFSLFNNGQIVNDYFNSDDIIFSNALNVDDNTIRVLRINTHQNIVTEELDALIDNSNDEAINNYSVNGRITNFKGLINSVGKTFDRMQINMILKPLTELSIYNDASNAGWLVKNHANPNGGPRVYLNTVSSSNSSAQPQSQTYDDDNNPTSFPTYWPNLYENTEYYNSYINSTNEVDSILTGNDSNLLYYSIAIIPAPQNGIVSPTFNYNLSVMWGINPSGTSNPNYPSRIIYQTPAPNTFSAPDGVRSIIAPNKYVYSGNPLGNNTYFAIVKTVYTKQIQLEVPIGLLPYDSLTVQTPIFTVEYTAYTIEYNDRTGNRATNVANLRSVTSSQSSGENITYRNISYTIQGLDTETPLSFSGALNSSDLQEFNLNVTAIHDDNTSTQITDTVKASAFYGIPLILNMRTTYQEDVGENTPPLSGDININLYGTTTTPLISADGYKVRFTIDPTGNYDVDYFESSISQLGTTVADLSYSNHTLSVYNGYSNITTWNNTVFSITSHTDETGTTILSIKDSNSTVVATLTTSNWHFLNTQSFITLCNNDVWKIDKYIGSSVSNNSLTEVFVPINYTVVQGGNTFENTFSPDVGVYVVGNGTTLSSATIPAVGYTFDFTLLQDSISVSLVGQADQELSPISELTYQYINGEDYSRILTLQNYRGYYGTQAVDQVYTLQRDQLTATFTITAVQSYLTRYVASQTFNVYHNKTVTVNNLIDIDDNNIGGIGLSITFHESMLSTTNIESFRVFTIGDSVSISITNSNYSAFTPVTINKSLNDFDLYEFSGSNYNSTGGPFKINSARLKIKNTAFDHTRSVYQFSLSASNASIRFLPNYLGNPENAVWDDSELLFSDIYGNWLLANGGGYGNGTNNNQRISNMQFLRTPNTIYLPSVSYVVVAPPYFKFTQSGNFTEESDLPYNPSVNAEDNLVYRYLPINNEGNTYYPFDTNTFVYSDNDTQITVNIDGNKTNNIQFIYNNSNERVTQDYVVTPNSSAHEIIVNGNRYEIKLYLGLKDSVSPQYLITLFNDSAEKLLTLPNNGNLSFVESINNNSGVILSYLQQLISYGNGITLSEIYADPSVDEIANNIHFEVDSFFLQIDNHNLDLQILQGISVSLFTKKLVMDGSGNMSVNVYKYPPISNNTNNNNQNFQVNTLFYNSREVKSIPVPPLNVQNSVVPNWNNRVESISYNDVANMAWVPDVAFNSTNTTIFASVVNLTNQAIGEVQPLIFACENTGIKKITLVNKQPLLKIVNKVGMPILEIDANGVIKTPILSTNSLILNPLSSTTVNSTLSNYSLYSILGNSMDNIL